MELKPLKDYHKQKVSKDGHNNKCAMCVNDYNKVKNRIKEKPRPDGSLRSMVIVHPSRYDYLMMYKAMEQMGYDLEKDIHLQFCEKYNLPPKQRQIKNKNKWSYKELI